MEVDGQLVMVLEYLQGRTLRAELTRRGTLSWPEALDDRLVAALRTLPEQERAVLLLRAISGLAYDEMAAALEIPMGSVMGYLSRARQKMRATLVRTELNRKTKP